MPNEYMKKKPKSSLVNKDTAKYCEDLFFFKTNHLYQLWKFIKVRWVWLFYGGFFFCRGLLLDCTYLRVAHK